MTKQTTVFLLAAVAVPMFFYFRSRCLFFGTVLTAQLTLALAACTWVWGKVFWTWTFVVPKAHAFKLSQGLSYLHQFMAQAYPLMIVAGAVFYLVFRDRRETTVRTQYFFWLSLVVGAIISGYIQAAKWGGGEFSYQIVTAFIAALCAVSIPLLFKSRWAVLFLLLPLGFFSAESRAVPKNYGQLSRQLIARVQNLPGEVWIPYHPWLGHLAGKKIYAPMESVYGQWNDGGQPMPSEFHEAVRDKLFNYVIFDSQSDFTYTSEAIRDEFVKNYSNCSRLPASERITPRDGWTTRHPSLFCKKSD